MDSEPATIELILLGVAVAFGMVLGSIFFGSRSDKSTSVVRLEYESRIAALESERWRVTYVLKQYANDRVLQILERDEADEEELWRAFELAASLSASFDEPVFEWLIPGSELLSALPARTTFERVPRAFELTQFARLYELSEIFCSELECQSRDQREAFRAFFSLGSEETPQQATERLFHGGAQKVADALRHEIERAQFNISLDYLPYSPND